MSLGDDYIHAKPSVPGAHTNCQFGAHMFRLRSCTNSCERMLEYTSTPSATPRCQIASNCGSDSHLMMVPSDCRSRRKGISLK